MLFLLLGLSLFLQQESAALTLRVEGVHVRDSKYQVIREVAKKWVEVGKRQYQRSLFNSAEKSLLEALMYREYLTVYDRTRLDGLLEKTWNALAERELILEHVRRANKLVTEGHLAEAKSALLKAKDRRFLSGKEHALIRESLNKIRARLRSERSAEDVGPSRSVTEQDALFVQRAKEPFIIRSAESERKQEVKEGYLDSISRKRKLKQSYGRAIVRDAVNRVRDCLGKEKFYKAKGMIAAAEQAVNENRMHLGDELFEIYKAELKQLSDGIEGGRKKWLGDVSRSD
jgi:hypothetical protein